MNKVILGLYDAREFLKGVEIGGSRKDAVDSITGAIVMLSDIKRKGNNVEKAFQKKRSPRKCRCRRC